MLKALDRRRHQFCRDWTNFTCLDAVALNDRVSCGLFIQHLKMFSMTYSWLNLFLAILRLCFFLILKLETQKLGNVHLDITSEVIWNRETISPNYSDGWLIYPKIQFSHPLISSMILNLSGPQSITATKCAEEKKKFLSFFRSAKRKKKMSNVLIQIKK